MNLQPDAAIRYTWGSLQWSEAQGIRACMSFFSFLYLAISLTALVDWAGGTGVWPRTQDCTSGVAVYFLLQWSNATECKSSLFNCCSYVPD